MNSRSSSAMPSPSASRTVGTACTGSRVGKRWSVTAGAFAWIEIQIAQGAELEDSLASAWAWTDSSPANRRARPTQTSARKRCRRRTSNWRSRIISRKSEGSTCDFSRAPLSFCRAARLPTQGLIHELTWSAELGSRLRGWRRLFGPLQGRSGFRRSLKFHDYSSNSGFLWLLTKVHLGYDYANGQLLGMLVHLEPRQCSRLIFERKVCAP